jgi:hypothetical protein
MTKPLHSVTRYFARQLLNKHAKNYQNVEKITKFLLSTEVVWKSIKHLSKTKSVKRFPSLKLCFSMFFFLTCTFWLQLCKIQIWRCDDRAPRPWVPNPAIGTGWVVISRVPLIQLDSLGQQLGPTACNLVVQLCRHGLQLFSLNF